MLPRVDVCMLRNPSLFSSSESSRPADVPAGDRHMAREELVRQMKAQRDQRQALLDAHDLPAADGADAFGRVARLAQQTFNVPVVLITFLGAEWQWFNPALGTDLDSVPLYDSFCIYTVQDETLLVVEDATQDERFADIPGVDGDLRVRFYAGAPLETPGGARVGTLCMFDVESRSTPTNDRRCATWPSWPPTRSRFERASPSTGQPSSGSKASFRRAWPRLWCWGATGGFST